MSDEIVINNITNLVRLDLNEIVLNLFVAAISGFWLTFCYQKNHKGLSYSQSFVHTILLTTIIMSLVVMTIGSSLVRAFALVGAMSIIRYRTVLKDTKDLTYIFAALVLGMGAGTGNFILVFVGSLFIGLLSFILTRTNYGAIYKSDYIISFNFEKKSDSKSYIDLLDKYCRIHNLINIESSDTEEYNKLTYEVKLIEEKNSEKLLNELSEITGLTQLFLVASKNDIDF